MGKYLLLFFFFVLPKEVLSYTLRTRSSSCVFSIWGFCPIETLFGTLILTGLFSLISFCFNKMMSSSDSPEEIERKNNFSVLTEKIKKLPEMADEQIILTLKECHDYFLKYPQDYAAMMVFSQIEKALGQYNNSIFYLKSAEKIIPSDLLKYCHFGLCECYEKQGDIKTALEYIEKARHECAGNYDDFAAKINSEYVRILELSKK